MPARTGARRQEGGNVKPLVNYLSELVMQSGGVYFPFDDSGAFARAVNPAVSLGRNIVLNGGFDTDTIWTKGTNWTIAAGVLSHATGGGSSSTTQVIAALVIGKSYEVTVTLSNVSAGGIQILVGSSGVGAVRSTNGTFTETIVCAGNTTLTIFQNGGTFVGDVDNVIVKQVNILASTAYPSAELLIDGNMEAVGTAAWTAVNSATLTKETVSPHGGAQVLRIARNGVNDPMAQQSILVVGRTYRVRGNCRSDGSAIPRVQDLGAVRFTGTTSTNWQEFDVQFTALTNSFRLSAITSTGTQYCEFDDVSVIEVNPLTAVLSGPQVGIDAGPRLLKAFSHDGINDFTNIYSADLNSVFNPDAGTVIVFAKMVAGVWVDATQRQLIIVNSGSETIAIARTVTNNQIGFSHAAGGVSKSVNFTFSPAPTEFVMYALTWDKAAGTGEMKANINGVQVGTTQTGIGTWVGNLTVTGNIVGALTTSGNRPASGLLTHPFLAIRAFTDAELLDIARRAGVAA